jgi:hypothetical protein
LGGLARGRLRPARSSSSSSGGRSRVRATATAAPSSRARARAVVVTFVVLRLDVAVVVTVVVVSAVARAAGGLGGFDVAVTAAVRLALVVVVVVGVAVVFFATAATVLAVGQGCLATAGDARAGGGAPRGKSVVPLGWRRPPLARCCRPLRSQRSTNAKRDRRGPLAVGVGAKVAERTARRAAANGLGSSLVKQAGRAVVTTIVIIIVPRGGAGKVRALAVSMLLPPTIVVDPRAL